RSVNLNEVVMDAWRMASPDALLHSCQLETSLDPNLPAIDGDPVQLQQVLLNLAINAFDAMRDTPASKRKVLIATQSNGDDMIRSNSLVFLIDDDASVRKGVSRLLRSAGYKNEAFRSASDFLAREQHSGPACLIVDVRMPELNGMDLQNVLIQGRREEQLVFI